MSLRLITIPKLVLSQRPNSCWLRHLSFLPKGETKSETASCPAQQLEAEQAQRELWGGSPVPPWE
jgi:hypothetical protein